MSEISSGFFTLAIGILLIVFHKPFAKISGWADGIFGSRFKAKALLLKEAFVFLVGTGFIATGIGILYFALNLFK